MAILTPKGETPPWMKNSNKPPNYAAANQVPTLRDLPTIAKEGLDSKEVKKLLENASPRPWKAQIMRVDDITQPNRLDILDANGKLVCHFHQVVDSLVDTENWENNARFIMNLVNIIEVLTQNKEVNS